MVLGSVSVIILLLFPIAIIGVVVWAARRGSIAFDVRQTYFYLVALVTLSSAVFSAFLVASGAFTVAFSNSPMPPDSSIWQQIAGALGMLLVAMPVWWLHWRDARRRALATKRLLALRIYLYAVTVTALVTAVIVGGIAVSEIIKALFGLVDFSSADSARMFWKDELTAVVNLLTALLVWFYHWRTVERVPANEDLEGSHP
jgi:hypothetical protein